MTKILGLRSLWLLVIYTLVDALCVGMGMGVPFFCILLGFLVGWVIVKVITLRVTGTQAVFREVLRYAGLTSAITLLGMVVVWGPFASYLFDPSKDLANSGIPMILYEPLASFIGWIVLMVVISPFLQLLTTLFGAHLALLAWMKNAQID